MARDIEFLQMALQSAQERQAVMDQLLQDTEELREKAYSDKADIKVPVI